MRLTLHSVEHRTVKRDRQRSKLLIGLYGKVKIRNKNEHANRESVSEKNNPVFVGG